MRATFIACVACDVAQHFIHSTLSVAMIVIAVYWMAREKEEE
jgi:hypothetical protein